MYLLIKAESLFTSRGLYGKKIFASKLAKHWIYSHGIELYFGVEPTQIYTPLTLQVLNYRF